MATQLLQNRYEFDPRQDELGKGGFGRVFKARDTLLDREVVLKYTEKGNLEDRYSLKEEIKRVIAFDHPNLTRYYDAIVIRSANDFGEEIERQIGIMEYVTGGNLSQYLAQHTPISKTAAHQLTTGILRGLAYLHRRNIIHRDIKPANVLIKQEGDELIPKLCDFGISKVVGSDKTNLSNVIGTPEYMSPEQCGFNPEGKISTNADLWSLGVMLYEMFAGELPFGSLRKGHSSAHIIGNIIKGELPAQVRQIPQPYQKIIQKCLVRDARERVQDTQVLLELLEKKPRKAPPQAPKVSDSTPVPPPSREPVSTPPAADQPPPPKPSAVPKPKQSQAERDKAAWLKVSGIHSIAGYEAYVKKYPQGAYVSAARKMLDSLRTGIPAPASQHKWVPILWALLAVPLQYLLAVMSEFTLFYDTPDNAEMIATQFGLGAIPVFLLGLYLFRRRKRADIQTSWESWLLGLGTLLMLFVVLAIAGEWFN